MELLIWMIVAYGMTTILVYGSIFNGLRDNIRKAGTYEGWFLTRPFFKFVSELISCMLCTGTWVGFFLSFATYSPWHEFIGYDRNFSIFFDGMLSAGAVWAINGVIEWFEENRPSNKN